MILKSSISEYTESEFLEFMRAIFEQHSAPTDDVLDPLLEHFDKITEHPSSTDLIYYSPDEESTPEAITKIIKEWRAQNGKPGFKSP